LDKNIYPANRCFCFENSRRLLEYSISAMLHHGCVIEIGFIGHALPVIQKTSAALVYDQQFLNGTLQIVVVFTFCIVAADHVIT